MPITQEIFDQDYGPNVGVKSRYFKYRSWERSPRRDGKLLLISNPYQLQHRQIESFEKHPQMTLGCSDWTGASFPYGPAPGSPELAPLRNQAIARLTGRVRQHNANLGVTLASWKQSRDMIVDRSQKVAKAFARVADRHYDEYKKMSPKQRSAKRRKLSRDRASDFLEGEFGWKPLVDDIQAGLGALAQTPHERWISASATGAFLWSENLIRPTEFTNRRTHEEGNFRVNVGCKCSFENPNVFLANRLGLLNLPGVAWDLIPWSFVVNMFSNAGQMVNSITDFVGVSTWDVCMTETVFIRQQLTLESTALANSRGSLGSAHMVKWKREKTRVRMSQFPKPTFQLKCPELNLELAGIAISLLLQKARSIHRLFGLASP